MWRLAQLSWSPSDHPHWWDPFSPELGRCHTPKALCLGPLRWCLDCLVRWSSFSTFSTSTCRGQVSIGRLHHLYWVSICHIQRTFQCLRNHTHRCGSWQNPQTLGTSATAGFQIERGTPWRRPSQGLFCSFHCWWQLVTPWWCTWWLVCTTVHQRSSSCPL